MTDVATATIAYQQALEFERAARDKADEDTHDTSLNVLDEHRARMEAAWLSALIA